MDTIYGAYRNLVEVALRDNENTLSTERREELKRQVWWGRMWQDPESPYQVVTLTTGQQELAGRLRTRISPNCFPTTDPADIPNLTDARIVTESLALGAKLLLTSNLRTIDRFEVNRWVIEHGERFGIRAEQVVYSADDAITEWTAEPEKLERWIQAGFLACWPESDKADATEVIESTIASIEALWRGDGGKLPQAAARLLNGLDKHPDPVALVERTRQGLPSRTVESDRIHPSYRRRPSRLHESALPAVQRVAG